MRLIAYIGPGAGLILSSSFLMMLAAGAVALSSLLIWPIRRMWRIVRGRRRVSS
jgi:hypothetical protein